MDSELFRGMLDTLVLEVLDQGPNYGYAIAQTVISRSGGAFELKEGSLYPALHRLEERRWLAAEWSAGPQGRRRKYYRLTAAGRKALDAKRAEWNRFAAGVAGVLGGDA